MVQFNQCHPKANTKLYYSVITAHLLNITLSMTKFDELNQRYPNLIPVEVLRANVSIIDLAIHYGYELQRNKGRSRPVLQHLTFQDVIIIKNPAQPNQQLYQQAGNFADSGTIIDFIRHRFTTVFASFNQAGQAEFRNITNVLYHYLRIDPTHLPQSPTLTTPVVKANSQQPFTKDHFDLRPLEPSNYLHQRHISAQTLSRPEFASLVFTQVTYFDSVRGHTDCFLTAKAHPERTYRTFSNVAFLYHNGPSSQVTGLEVRNQQLKRHAPGSDRLRSVFVTNPPPQAERFYVLESAIDALSHQQLRSLRGDDAFNSVYFSTGGQLTPQQVGTIIGYLDQFKKAPEWKLMLAFDNDVKGHLYDLQFIQLLIAAQLPLSSLVMDDKTMGYQLPGQAVYGPIVAALLGQIETYNKCLPAGMTMESVPASQPELARQLITLKDDSGQLVVSIPQERAPLSAVSRMLLALTQFDEHIGIEKSGAKDYNEELMRREVV